MYYLDQTRFVQFWENPEKFRIVYLNNIVPKILPYGLQRGLGFHLLVDAYHKKQTEEVIMQRFATEGVGEEAQKNARILLEVYLRDRTPYDVVVTEAEFKVPLEGGHFLVGRLDQILNTELGVINGELKTGYDKTKEAYEIKNWRTKRQADTLILGSRALGFELDSVLPIYAIESVPPKLWELPLVSRTEFELELTKRAFAQTCDMIETMIEKYGKDDPWPFINSPFRRIDEYEHLYGMSTSSWSDEDLADFKERREHLDMLRDKI